MPWLAALLVAGATHLTPMRWFSGEAESLALLDGSPVNALLVEGQAVSPAFAKEAARRKVQVFAVVPAEDSVAVASAALLHGAAGLVVEAEPGRGALGELRKAAAGRSVIDLRDRASVACTPGSDGVMGASQGVWPGIRFDESGISAGPTGTPWIESNSGFVRFLRSQSEGEIWMAQRVRPPGQRGAVTLSEYLRAIADAALGGGRWVIDLDPEFQRALLGRDPARLRDWRRIGELLRYFDEQAAWARYKPASELALPLDCRMAALSGGVLDLFASQHIPVRPVAARAGELRLLPAGAAPFLAPEGWSFPPSAGGAFEISPAQSTALGFVYELTRDGSLRTNFGARLFNVAGALSNLVASPDGRTVVLHIVNYTDYPMEQITVDLAGACRTVRLWRPGAAPRALAMERVGGGTRVEIERMEKVASVECRR